MQHDVMDTSASTLWNDQRCRQHGWWLLLVLALMLYLPGTATIPLMDRDEPRFAHATVEMMERDSWAIPYFNGAYRFDKPPLTYWWMRLHYALLGVNELSARLHSLLAVYGVALVVAGMARKLTKDSRAGPTMRGGHADDPAGGARLPSFGGIADGAAPETVERLVLVFVVIAWCWISGEGTRRVVRARTCSRAVAVGVLEEAPAVGETAGNLWLLHRIGNGGSLGRARIARDKRCFLENGHG